jgi:hypothetical protein
MVISYFLCAFVLASAASAAAADFTITVPVRLYNMVQGVGKAKVTCEVVDSQGQRIGVASKWSNNHVNQYPTGLEEDIVLEFNASPGKDPRNATSYKCDLKLQLAWINDEPWQTPSQNSNNTYLKPKPGTEFRVEDSGPLYKTQPIPKQSIKPKLKDQQLRPLVP